MVAGASSCGLCGYCDIPGHDAKICRKKQCDKVRRGGCFSQESGGPSTQTSSRSLFAVEQEVLAIFRRLSSSEHGIIA
uniref:Uncharacterized protein n=1 Tax=Arundo donax TaxID=35708 RepID=A0A0A9AWE1_ARUDO